MTTRKLTRSDVRRIYRMATNARLTHAEIASRFGIHRSMVGKILHGNRWSSVTNNI